MISSMRETLPLFSQRSQNFLGKESHLMTISRGTLRLNLRRGAVYAMKMGFSNLLSILSQKSMELNSVISRTLKSKYLTQAFTSVLILRAMKYTFRTTQMQVSFTIWIIVRSCSIQLLASTILNPQMILKFTRPRVGESVKKLTQFVPASKK